MHRALAHERFGSDAEPPERRRPRVLPVVARERRNGTERTDRGKERQRTDEREEATHGDHCALGNGVRSDFDPAV
jgi:hypothetical protein